MDLPLNELKFRLYATVVAYIVIVLAILLYGCGRRWNYDTSIKFVLPPNVLFVVVFSGWVLRLPWPLTVFFGLVVAILGPLYVRALQRISEAQKNQRNRKS